MTDQRLYDGRLHSPFFIFIRQPHGYLDVEFLARFKLSSYRRSTEPSSAGRHAIMCDAGDWTMLADDWYYTLWHMKTTRPAIEAIAEFHELYACSEGDCDRSFDFLHYRKGKLRRKYVVSSPSYSNRVVVEDFGPPLPGEATLLRKDGCNIGIELAATLGIKTHFTDDDLRVYAPLRDPSPQREVAKSKRFFLQWSPFNFLRAGRIKRREQAE